MQLFNKPIQGETAPSNDVADGNENLLTISICGVTMEVQRPETGNGSIKDGVFF